MQNRTLRGFAAVVLLVLIVAAGAQAFGAGAS